MATNQVAAPQIVPINFTTKYEVEKQNRLMQDVLSLQSRIQSLISDINTAGGTVPGGGSAGEVLTKLATGYNWEPLGPASSIAWANISGKPTTFPPAPNQFANPDLTPTYEVSSLQVGQVLQASGTEAAGFAFLPLEFLADVQVASPGNGQMLGWDSAVGAWTNQNVPGASFSGLTPGYVYIASGPTTAAFLPFDASNILTGVINTARLGQGLAQYGINPSTDTLLTGNGWWTEIQDIDISWSQLSDVPPQVSNLSVFSGDFAGLVPPQAIPGEKLGYLLSDSGAWVPPAGGPTGPRGTPGAPGLPGEDGIDGDMGMPGLAGTAGAAGSPGAAGAAGGMGPPGYDGDEGAEGIPGVPGSAGAAGAKGSTGSAGAAGAPGSIGPPGYDGDEGAEGIPGAPGSPGAAGATGSTGSAGAAGAAGLLGPPGYDGNDGEDGYPGAPGSAGAAGATGSTGSAGAPGTAGATGMMGPPGNDGDDGAEGIPGIPGAVGATGTAGSTGATGATGLVGVPGPEGEDGDDGDRGPPGSPGAAGATGSTGSTGAPGAVGATGMMGPPGDDGDDGDEWQIPGPAGPAGAGASSHAPTAKVGATAVTGTALTFMTSDSAPPIDLTFTPTMTGAWVFTPTAGIALTLNAFTGQNALFVQGVANTYAVDITGSATSGQSFGLSVVAGSNGSDVAFSVENNAATIGFLEIFGSGLITSTGQWVYTPIAGTQTLTVTGAANQYGVQVLGSSTTGQSYGLQIIAGTNASDNPFVIEQHGGSITFLAMTGQGITTINGAWTFNGEGTFNAAAGTYGLLVNGVDSNYTCSIVGSTTSTKSYGLAITAGTTSADTSFLVQSSAGAAVLAKITGDGATYLYGPKIGFYTATPVVQVTGWGTPLNGTKLVSMNGTTTYTVVQLGACIAEILIVLKGLGLIGA